MLSTRARQDKKQTGRKKGGRTDVPEEVPDDAGDEETSGNTLEDDPGLVRGALGSSSSVVSVGDVERYWRGAAGRWLIGEGWTERRGRRRRGRWAKMDERSKREEGREAGSKGSEIVS